jgi:hypothetical protein
MLRVYFPPSTPGEDELDLVQALRGGENGARDDLWNRRFRHLHENARLHFKETPLSEAEVVVYPQMYRPGRAALEAVEAARTRKLPIVFVRTGDAPDPVQVPAGIVYRHSIFAARRLPCEDAMPAFGDDMLLERGGELQVRRKGAEPRLGFRGYVSEPRMRLLYRLMGRKRKAEGLELRAMLLKRLLKTPGVLCDVVQNNRFLGGREGIANHDPQIAAQVREDFVQNVLDNDYTLCVRGAGNFSYRFYEVLSAGRIPLYVDTDTVLPFADEIDWKQHCVWVGEDELDRIGPKLLEFHRRIDPQQFEAIQRSNRQLWLDYLTPLAFYRRALSRAVTRYASIEGHSVASDAVIV